MAEWRENIFFFASCCKAVLIDNLINDSLTHSISFFFLDSSKSRVEVAKPVVEMDGDEMTRVS